MYSLFFQEFEDERGVKVGRQFAFLLISFQQLSISIKFIEQILNETIVLDREIFSIIVKSAISISHKLMRLFSKLTICSKLPVWWIRGSVG